MAEKRAERVVAVDRGERPVRVQAVWKRREIAVLPDSAWGEVALVS
jgi:hypothetical protein